MDSNVERSKFIQKQKQARSELEKKVKKLKGAMKEAAQKELEELDAKQEAELAEFDKQAAGTAGSGGSGGYSAAPEAKKGGSGGYNAAADAKKEDPPVAEAVTKFKERNWNGLSKKELEECCVERGLGKKGSKEDLVTKLTQFHMVQSQRQTAAASSHSEPAAKPKAKGKAKSGKAAVLESSDDDDDDDSDDDSDDDDSDDDDDDDDSSEDEDDQEDVDPEELERQGKREKAMQKAIKFLLAEKCKDGFLLKEFEQKLESIKVTGFSPEKCGYKTVEKFIRGQPPALLFYNKKKQTVLPPK